MRDAQKIVNDALFSEAAPPIQDRILRAEAEVERLREEYRRLAWCHLGVGGNGCASCRDRAEALGLAPAPTGEDA